MSILNICKTASAKVKNLRKIATHLEFYLFSQYVWTQTKYLCQTSLLVSTFVKSLFSTIWLVAILLKINSNNFIDFLIQGNNDFMWCISPLVI